MEETISLSWDCHQNNICNGLSLLQQRGEFVDMTLAADGHHVKVHQMVMSLISPYIKDLISTAKCPHPVIFLNNISYTTLCAILEYIYTGEVVVPKEKLSDLLAAGRALHIKGLREMDDTNTSTSGDALDISPLENSTTIKDNLREHKENRKHNAKRKAEPKPQPMCEIFVDLDNDNDCNMEILEDTAELLNTQEDDKPYNTASGNDTLELVKNVEYSSPGKAQYSISNQGNLQVVINRYIYNLKYVQKNLSRHWRCVDYAYKKCPANVYTNNKNEVLRRKCTHNHPFHDEKILKKLGHGLIFTAYNEAEDKAREKKTGELIEIIPYQTQTQNSDSE